MSRPIQLTHCTLHLDRNEIEAPGGTSGLTVMECDLLSYLVAHSGRTITKAELLRNVWHYAPGVLSRAPDHTINRLRAKLEADPKNPDHLITVYGIGYRLDLPESSIIPEVAAPSPVLPVQPAPPKPLRGRVAALAEVERWRGSSRRWLTIVGPGGMGKTHLARAVVAGEAVLWCDLRTAQSEAEAIAAVGAGLGLQLPGDVQAASAQIVQVLGAWAPALIVLDNLEQVEPAGLARLHSWLDLMPQTQVLATSRTPLRLASESILRLGSLKPATAAELFHARVQSILGDGQDWEEEAVQALLAQLDGVPLAIELAAGRMGILGPRELCSRLAQDVGILGGGKAGHQETLLKTLESSWALLDPVEQAVLRQCTVFRRAFDLRAIEAVVRVPEGSDPVSSVLAGLVDASLLHRVDGPCFDFLVLTRQFVEGKGPAPADVAGRHMVFFHALALDLQQGRWTAQEDDASQEIIAALPDLLAAMSVAEVSDPGAFSELVWVLQPLLGRQIPADQAQRLAQSAVDLSEVSGSVEDRCRALSARGQNHLQAGRWEQSFADLEQGIALALDQQLLGAAAKLEMQLGSHLLPRGEVDRAEQAYVCGLAHAQAAQDTRLEGRAWTGLARVDVYADRQAAAFEHFEQALRCTRSSLDRVGECRTLGLMGRLEARRGQLAQAELHFRDALDCYRDQVLPGRFAWILASRTEISLRWGRVEHAERCAESALVITKLRGTPAELAVAEFNLGMLLLETGAIDGAEAHIRSARRVVQQMGLRRFLGDVTMGLAWVHFERGEYPQAEVELRQAEAIHAETQNTTLVASVLGLRGLCAIGRGAMSDGIAALSQAVAVEGIDPRASVYFSVALAVAQIAAGVDEHAGASLQSAVAVDPQHQIDLMAAGVLAELLLAWLREGRSTAGHQAITAHVKLCRMPGGAGLSAPAACSSELRWLIGLVERLVLD
jgi:tetratricopeptide (TPR) repeat protein/DNA-binding winged helix-turn-helix (wHTH) protein